MRLKQILTYPKDDPVRFEPDVYNRLRRKYGIIMFVIAILMIIGIFGGLRLILWGESMVPIYLEVFSIAYEWLPFGWTLFLVVVFEVAFKLYRFPPKAPDDRPFSRTVRWFWLIFHCWFILLLIMLLPFK